MHTYPTPSADIAKISLKPQVQIKDDDGYIWIATANGLSRFDGYDFFTYHTRQTGKIFSSSSIRHIDILGNLIIVTTGKEVELFDKSNETIRPVTDSTLWDANMKCSLFLDTHNIVMGGSRGLFIHNIPDATTSAVAADGAADKSIPFVRCIYKDRFGNIWVGTWRNGVYVLLEGEKTARNIDAEGLPANLFVTGFVEYEDSIISSSWEEGLFVLNRNGT